MAAKMATKFGDVAGPQQRHDQLTIIPRARKAMRARGTIVLVKPN